MEKVDRGWSADLAAEPSLLEAGMERAAAAGEYYTGRRVFATRRASGELPYRLAYLLRSTPAGLPTGSATSRKPELAAIGTALEILILGEKRRATVIAEPAYDPKNERLRG